MESRGELSRTTGITPKLSKYSTHKAKSFSQVITNMTTIRLFYHLVSQCVTLKMCNIYIIKKQNGYKIIMVFSHISLILFYL